MALWQDLRDFLGERWILIIEPRMHFRVSMQNFLNRLQCEQALFVSSAEEGRAAARTRKIGLFIAEWQLPDKNGLEICREFRKDPRYRATPYLLMTMENQKADIVLASEGGISGYLLKPFSYQDFCDQLRLILSYEKNPDHLQLLLERAEDYLERKELWVAEALFTEALTMKPQSARATCGLGKIELLRQNPEKAISCFKQAVANNPDYIDGYKQLLKISEEQKDHAGVVQGAKILHNLSPENPKYPLIIAAAQMELRRFADAEEYFKLTLKLSPTLAAAYKGLGHLYLKTKDFEKAALNLEKALDLEQSDVSTLNSLGLAYVRQSFIDKGIDRYRLALSIDPNDPRVLFNLGLALELKGKVADAVATFQLAYQIDPGFDKVRRKLSETQQRLGRTGNAHKLARPA